MRVKLSYIILACTFMAVLALPGCSSVRGERFTTDNTERVLEDVKKAHLQSTDLLCLNEALTRASVGAYTLKGQSVGDVIGDQRAFDEMHSSDLLAAMHWYAHLGKEFTHAQQEFAAAEQAAGDDDAEAVQRYTDLAQSDAGKASVEYLDGVGVPIGWGDVAQASMDAGRDLSQVLHSANQCSELGRDECMYEFQQGMRQVMQDLKTEQDRAEYHYRRFGRHNLSNNVSTCTMAAVLMKDDFAREERNAKHAHRQPKIRYPTEICGDYHSWLST